MESAKRAISQKNNEKIDGRRIVVEMAGDRPPTRANGPKLQDSCYNCQREGHWYFKKVK